MSARETILLALTQYYRSNADPRGTAVQVLDGYDAARRTELLAMRADTRDRMCRDAHAAGRAEVLAEADLLPKADVVAWLIKKAREGTPVEVLASKVERGAVRPDNLRMLPTFFQPGHTYVREHHGETIRFLVEHVGTSPDGSYYAVAFGWRWLGDEELASPSDSDDFTGWTDITDAKAVTA